MFEESVLASMNSWLTPTVLFVFLNIMIGTIVIISGLGSKKPNNPQPPPQHDHHGSHPQLRRSPSVLQRLKSINFYSYTPPEPPTGYFTRPPASDQDQLQTTAVRSDNLEIEQPDREEEAKKDEDGDDEIGQTQSIDDIYRQLKAGNHGHVPVTEEPPPPEKPRRKMKKSSSAKLASSHLEDIEARRPATVREVRVLSEENDDEEVDAKADDFINRFKQQLKLQRLDSLLRRGARK